MEKRHLLETDQQQGALAEFNDLERIKEIVDWSLFVPVLEATFGPPGRRDGVVDPGIIWLSFVLFSWGSCIP